MLKTTFAEAQAEARVQLARFFATDDNAEMLHKILTSESPSRTICLLDHFIVGDPRRLICSGDTIVNTHSAYRSNLRTQKKRMFDFTSAVGKGPLWWEDKHNPPFYPSSRHPEDGATIACLSAIQFAIRIGAMDLFWASIDDVSKSYIDAAEKKKRFYQNNHRTVSKIRRERAEAFVLAERREEDRDLPRTREERLKIKQRIEAERAAERESRNKGRKGTRERRKSRPISSPSGSPVVAIKS